MAAKAGAEIGLIRLPRVETQPRQIVAVETQNLASLR